MVGTCRFQRGRFLIVEIGSLPRADGCRSWGAEGWFVSQFHFKKLSHFDKTPATSVSTKHTWKSTSQRVKLKKSLLQWKWLQNASTWLDDACWLQKDLDLTGEISHNVACRCNKSYIIVAFVALKPPCKHVSLHFWHSNGRTAIWRNLYPAGQVPGSRCTRSLLGAPIALPP